jgi:hypothetical protein
MNILNNIDTQHDFCEYVKNNISTEYHVNFKLCIEKNINIHTGSIRYTLKMYRLMYDYYGHSEYKDYTLKFIDSFPEIYNIFYNLEKNGKIKKEQIIIQK